MVAAGLALLGSLFLPWSHQLSPALRTQYGATAALQGVSPDPTGWQVFSVVDVVLAVVAGCLLAAAMRGGRPARLVLMAAVAVAVAFTIHALSVPPTNGALVFDSGRNPPAYTPNGATTGPGETLALVALGLGLGGLALSFTVD
jgi:uncharacterized membrane protein